MGEGRGRGGKGVEKGGGSSSSSHKPITEASTSIHLLLAFLGQ